MIQSSPPFINLLEARAGDLPGRSIEYVYSSLTLRASPHAKRVELLALPLAARCFQNLWHYVSSFNTHPHPPLVDVINSSPRLHNFSSDQALAVA